jgi:molybdate transport system substrate-binding protein
MLQAQEGLHAEELLRISAATALRPALEQAAQTFQALTGIPVRTRYASSGKVVSDPELTADADLLVPGDKYFAEQAWQTGTAVEEGAVPVAYLAPVFVVARGNPLSIVSLSDLLRPNIKIALADPDKTCLGQASRRALGDLFGKVQAKAELVTNSCEETVRAVADGRVDVAVGWHSFRSWFAKDIDLIRPTDIGDVDPSVALAMFTSHSQHKKVAEQFLAYLRSEDGISILRNWGYGTSPEEARSSVAKLTFVRGW